MTTMTQISPFAPESDAHLAAYVARTRARLAQWRLYRKTLSELADLSDRQLTDLGLHRSELKRVAYMAVYQS